MDAAEAFFSPNPVWPLAAAGFHHRLREQASHDRAHPEPWRAVAAQHVYRPFPLRARHGSDWPAQRLQGVYLERVFKDARSGVSAWVVAGPVLSNGVLVVDAAEEAQMIVEVRSGANSLDSSTATLGIAEDQALPNPVTGAPWRCRRSRFSSAKTILPCPRSRWSPIRPSRGSIFSPPAHCSAGRTTGIFNFWE